MPNLDELLVELELRCEAGTPVSGAEVCPESPELAAELEQRFRRLRGVERLLLGGLDEPLDETELDSPPPAIAGYTIERILGAGGMGKVYLARNHELNRVEALKVLRPGERRRTPTDQNRLAKRFLREAQTLASLKHEHIVAVYQGRPRADTPYFAMEYLPRGSLAQEVERRRLIEAGPRAIVTFMRKVARAVEYAHQNRVLHRDLKPGNILLDDRGEPIVSDFGLAKILDPAADSDEGGGAANPLPPSSGDDTATSAVSLPGQQPGTPGYMAPEQHDPSRGPVSIATDIWALGVILYELLSGVRPFTGQGAQVRDHILHAEPLPPTKWPAGGKLSLERIVFRCLEKTPGERFASAGELADALETWEHEQERAARPSWGKWIRRHRVAVALVGLVGLVAAAVIVVRYDPDRPWHEIRDEMRCGRPVTLISERGAPRYSRPVYPDTVQTGLDADGFFTVQAWKHALLELAREVPWDEYRIRCKVRHDKSVRDGRIGVYFACQNTPSTHGRAHFFYSLRYNDIVDYEAFVRSQPKPPPVIREGNFVALIPSVWAQIDVPHLWKPDFDTWHIARFRCAGYGGGKWRDLAIEVRRDELRASFDGAGHRPIKLALHEQGLSASFEELMRKDPGRLVFFSRLDAKFHRHGACGIFIEDGAAAFAECVIEPLSQPEGS